MKSIDLTLAEASTELYGWKPHAGDPRDSGRQFRPEEIGIKRHNCVRGTVSKAFKRLELRGYAKQYAGVGEKWTGINLTPGGLAAAKSDAGSRRNATTARTQERTIVGLTERQEPSRSITVSGDTRKTKSRS